MQWNVWEGILLTSEMSEMNVQGQNITVLLKELFKRQNITYLLKGMYRDESNHTVKNVQDGTLHMK